MIGKQSFLDFNSVNNDRLYEVSIPKYFLTPETVLYLVEMVDLISNKRYWCQIRYRRLKELQKRLKKQYNDLPPFPETHFWTATNKNKALIEERKIQLEQYLNTVLNVPILRGNPEVKTLVKLLKQGDNRHRFSTPHSIPSERERSWSTVSKDAVEISKEKIYYLRCAAVK